MSTQNLHLFQKNKRDLRASYFRNHSDTIAEKSNKASTEPTMHNVTSVFTSFLSLIICPFWRFYVRFP